MLSLSIGLEIKVCSLITTYSINTLHGYKYIHALRERMSERMNLRTAYLSDIDDMVAKVSGSVDNSYDD